MSAARAVYAYAEYGEARNEILVRQLYGLLIQRAEILAKATDIFYAYPSITCAHKQRSAGGIVLG